MKNEMIDLLNRRLKDRYKTDGGQGIWFALGGLLSQVTERTVIHLWKFPLHSTQ
jgi:hypothetical protein